jgi:hypothetical protein
MNGSKRPEIGARRLRELAETADGFRDENLKLVFIPGAKDDEGYKIMTEEERKSTGADEICDVRTKSKVAGRKRPAMTLSAPRPESQQASGSPDAGSEVAESNDVNQLDAIFLTESAAEKFLFPYYDHMRLFGEEYIKKIRDDFFDKKKGPYILALGHIPPSKTRLVENPKDTVRIIIRSNQFVGGIELLTHAEFEQQMKSVTDPA